MPRPISWLSSVQKIHRKVSESARSHWTRHDLEDLFGVAPRSARKLIETMKRTILGRNIVVRREDLDAFLVQVRETPEREVPRLFEKLRAENPEATRRKIRVRVDRDGQLSPANQIPKYAHLRRGRCEISFRTPEELLTAFIGIAAQLHADDAAFERDYCPAPVESNGVRGLRILGEGQRLLAELAAMQAESFGRGARDPLG